MALTGKRLARCRLARCRLACCRLTEDALVKRTPPRRLDLAILRWRLRRGPTESRCALEGPWRQGRLVFGKVEDGCSFALARLKFFVLAIPPCLDRPHAYGRAWTLTFLPRLGTL
ncbi:MAG TPA: hypothetical protein VEJ84_17540 [Acidimicrobiales bacterium]|nr:hypothetical protein [Acidimicrobiales bacterium]